MIIDGTKTLAADRATVWAALADPAFLQRTIPDCRSVTTAEDGAYVAKLAVGVGPIRANFDAGFTRTVAQEGLRFVLAGQGSAGVAGAARGTVEVVLSDIAGGTLLVYTAQTEISGKFAQLGARMLDGAARKFSEQFFAQVQRELSAPRDTGAASRHAGEPSTSPAMPGGLGAPPAGGRGDAPASAAAHPAPAWAAWKPYGIAIACAVGSFVGTFCANLLR